MTKRKPSFQVRSSVLCDEIRQEISNKLILIGVYTGDIIVPQFPATVPVSVYAEIWFYSEGERLLNLSYIVDGEQRGGVNAHLLIRDASEPFILTLSPLPVQLLVAGELEIFATAEGERPVKLISRKVRRAETASSGISEQPSSQSPTAS